MFLNVSNHPSSRWSKDQLEEARVIGGGEVKDLAFPNVDPRASTEQLAEQAELFLEALWAACPSGPVVVMLAGQMNLVQHLLTLGRAEGSRARVRWVEATTEQVTLEEPQPDGSTKVTKIFRFVQFRDYAN